MNISHSSKCMLLTCCLHFLWAQHFLFVLQSHQVRVTILVILYRLYSTLIDDPNTIAEHHHHHTPNTTITTPIRLSTEGQLLPAQSTANQCISMTPLPAFIIALSPGEAAFDRCDTTPRSSFCDSYLLPRINRLSPSSTFK